MKKNYILASIPLIHLCFCTTNPNSILLVAYLLMLSISVTLSKALIYHRLFLTLGIDPQINSIHYINKSIFISRIVSTVWYLAFQSYIPCTSYIILYTFFGMFTHFNRQEMQYQDDFFKKQNM